MYNSSGVVIVDVVGISTVVVVFGRGVVDCFGVILVEEVVVVVAVVDVISAVVVVIVL